MIKNVEDINILFRKRIIPICMGYGMEYLSAGTTMQSACQEALLVLDNKDMESFVSYLLSTNLPPQDSEVE